MRGRLMGKVSRGWQERHGAARPLHGSTAARRAGAAGRLACEAQRRARRQLPAARRLGLGCRLLCQRAQQGGRVQGAKGLLPDRQVGWAQHALRGDLVQHYHLRYQGGTREVQGQA